MAQLLEQHADYRVLRRFVPRERYSDITPVRVARGIVLDVETTGRDPRADEIIELGMVAFEFDPDAGAVLRVTDVYDELRDPGRPIPPDAANVNGITDDMVRGKTLDNARIEAMVGPAELLVAHNAAFDRVFCERLSPVFADKAWACSQYEVPWAEAGIASAKLEFIASRFGLFYDAHRAEIDCRMLLELLARELPNLDGSVLATLLARSRERTVRLYAMDARFETKSLLQARGYRWGAGENGHERAWYREVPDSDAETEVNWLRTTIYQNRPFSLIQDTVDAFSRYSGRRAGTQRVYYST
jgi:DNA polymerase-3 subunit epsilon